MHNLFSTIYLWQEQKLNPTIYPKQETIMSNFVQATNNYVHMYANLKYIGLYRSS
jgi:hypothetical protein